MERFVLLCLVTPLSISSALDQSLITVLVPPVSGVRLLTGPKGQYQFNFSEASEACLVKNLSIASRSQLQTALDDGLEACRFGWISEQVAAVPRLSPVSTCGTGKTGVVMWNASPQKQFGVWCFGHSDSNEAEKTTVGVSQAPTVYPTTTTPQRTSTLTSAALTSFALTMTVTTTTVPTTNPRMKPLTSTRTTRVTSAPEKQKTFPSESASTPSPTLTSKSFMTLMTRSSSAAASMSNVINYSSTPAVNSARPRALSTALIGFCVVVLVLSAGGAVFYYKLSERWVWPHAEQKDDPETETCKQTCSELELQEEGRKFSSETMLYVNHDARTDAGF